MMSMEFEAPMEFENTIQFSSTLNAVQNEYKTLEQRAKECTRIEYQSKFDGLVNDLAGDIRNIPVFGEVAGVFTAPINMAGHVGVYSLDMQALALGCDDVPFDELKKVMGEKFNEVNRKLDKQMEMLEKMSKILKESFNIIEKLRSDMKAGFHNILETIDIKEIRALVFRIKNFIEYFEMERKAVKDLTVSEYVEKLEEENGLLLYLKDSRTPKGDSLNTALNELIDPENHYAVPKSANDRKAFQALFSAFYGTQSYVAVMFFLLEQHSFLADHYYEQGKFTQFNKQLDKIFIIFKDFKLSLAGGTHNPNALISKLIGIFEDDILGKKIITYRDGKLHKIVVNFTKILKKLKSDIELTKLPLIEDVPKPPVQINFENSTLHPPLVNWIEGVKVSYAVQYEKNGTYSKLSDWTVPVRVMNLTNPILKVSGDKKPGRHCLLFRKFDDQKPELIGKLSTTQKDFRDINRDVYDAVMGVYKNVTLFEVNRLIDAGANINSPFELGRTAMHAAALRGNVKVALKFLLKNATKIEIKDKKGYTPMHVAAEAGRAGFVRFLVNHGAKVNAKTTVGHLSPLHLSARNGFLSTVRSLLNSNDTKVNQIENEGYTPLHAAVVGGSIVVDALLEHKNVNVMAKSKAGLTAFHLAVMKEDIKVIQSFVKHQIDLNIGDKNGMTSLHYAVMNGSKGIVQYLLSLGSRININAVTLNRFWSPLHFAIYFKRDDVFSLLLENENINLDLVTHEGVTPLHLAVATGQTIAVGKLLEKGSKLEVQTKKGYTPLQLSILRKEPEMYLFLLEKDANINTKSAIGESALHLAASRGALNIAMSLLARGATLIDYDNREYTPTHYAVLNKNVEMVELLVIHDRRSILNKKSKEYTKLLSIIEQHVVQEVFKLLKKNYDKPVELNDILKSADKEGIVEIWNIVFGGSRKSHSKDSESQLKNFLCRAIELGTKCFKDIDKCSTMVFDSGSKMSELEYWKKCHEEKSQHYSRALRGNKKDSIPSQIRRNRERFGGDLVHNNFDLSQSYSSLPGKPSENFNRFQQTEDHLFKNTNTIGILMLLDVLLRKITKGKYVSKRSYSVSEVEAQVNALSITEKFEDMINTVINIPADEQVDLSEVHSSIYKAIMSDKGSSISDILCSYVKKFSEIKIENLDQLVDTYMSKMYSVSPSNSRSFGKLVDLLEDTCLSNEAEIKSFTNKKILS